MTLAHAARAPAEIFFKQASEQPGKKRVEAAKKAPSLAQPRCDAPIKNCSPGEKIYKKRVNFS